MVKVFSFKDSASEKTFSDTKPLSLSIIVLRPKKFARPSVLFLLLFPRIFAGKKNEKKRKKRALTKREEESCSESINLWRKEKERKGVGGEKRKEQNDKQTKESQEFINGSRTPTLFSFTFFLLFRCVTLGEKMAKWRLFISHQNIN